MSLHDGSRQKLLAGPIMRFGWSHRLGAGNNVQNLFHETLGLVSKQSSNLIQILTIKV